MSSLPEDGRPKLKAKRFNKFHSSVETSVTDTSSHTGQDRQGLKRKNEESFQIPSQPKKKYEQSAIKPPITQNLANKRLQNLKRYLKSDVKHGNSRIEDRSQEEKNQHSSFQRRDINSVSVSQDTSCNIYKNLSQWASPPLERKMSLHEYDKGINSNNAEQSRSAQGKQEYGSFTKQVRQLIHSDCTNPQSLPNNDTKYGSEPQKMYTVHHTQEDRSIVLSKHSNSTSPVMNFKDFRESKRCEQTINDEKEQAVTEGRSSSIYKNLGKWATPPNTIPQKNLAGSRLQKLKSVLKDAKPVVGDKSTNCSTANSPTVENSEEKYRSPLLREKYRSPLFKDTGISNKRHITDDFVSECSPAKKIVVNPSFSSLSRSYSKNNSNEIRDRSTSSENLNKDAVNVSQRTVRDNVSLNESNCSTSFQNINSTVVLNDFHRENNEIHNSPSTPISKRLNFIRNKPDKSYNLSTNAKPSVSNFNTPSKLSQPQKENPTECLVLSTENTDNFSEKMAMTAFWVSNLNNENLTQSPIELNCKQGINVVEEVNNKIQETPEDNSMEMEWTNAEPDNEIVQNNHNEEETDSNTVEQPETKNQPSKSNDLCIVVDTNIFIHGLSKIKDIINMKISGPIQLVLYIPWMVITELDYMKHDCSLDSLKRKVTNSVKFINSHLEEQNPRLVGQTVYEMEKQKFIGKSPDDKIISCCLQAAEKYETVILLSNDLNLKSKAMINHLTACSEHDIIMKILSITKNTKAQKIMQKMSILCSSVICEFAKETYGEVWSKMSMLSNPPWSLAECLKRFKKYWGTIFKDKLLKQFTKTIDDLLQLFNENKYFPDDSEDYIRFVKLCINMCIFLKDIEEIRGSVENVLTDIKKFG
ncbi:swt1 RNA endoribonuclease [Leptinotarsa decemlineata]|uniref:swt1 RNA endoribonuclease n=1 Tax=Leptinotarsa decemlineata TaxID=7539 RepID=UPI003D3056A4